MNPNFFVKESDSETLKLSLSLYPVSDFSLNFRAKVYSYEIGIMSEYGCVLLEKEIFLN